MQLTPGGVHMRELIDNAPDLVDQPRGVSYSWPVIASGVERTYSLTTATESVRSPVYRACALLSLVWGKHWLPRSGPHLAAIKCYVSHVSSLSAAASLGCAGLRVLPLLWPVCAEVGYKVMIGAWIEA